MDGQSCLSMPSDANYRLKELDEVVSVGVSSFRSHAQAQVILLASKVIGGGCLRANRVIDFRIFLTKFLGFCGLKYLEC